jgi:hypothetical protein
MQQSAEPAYEPRMALNRGTLVPGTGAALHEYREQDSLDNTPLVRSWRWTSWPIELMLYLDTHKDDTEAFETLQSILHTVQEAKRRLQTDAAAPLPMPILANAGSSPGWSPLSRGIQQGGLSAMFVSMRRNWQYPVRIKTRTRRWQSSSTRSKEVLMAEDIETISPQNLDIYSEQCV